MDLNVFYENVEAERARKGWTIAECAEYLGIDEKTYRNRNYACTDIRVSALIDYATVFNCSTDYLLGLTDTVRVK